MHSDEVLVEAIKRRLKGVAIKEIARELGVSVGWASETLSGIQPKLKVDRPMLSASDHELQTDVVAWGAARQAEYRHMNPRKRRQREETVDRLREATKDFSELPPTNTREYALLDRLQQLLAREPYSGVFHVVQGQSPKLMAHLLGWLRDKHRKTQDKSDDRFRYLAQGVRDYVVAHLQPPSYASSDKDEIAMARWLGRWVSNARGRGERRRNVERASLMIEIGWIVERLRSNHPETRGKGVKAVRDGTWSELFDRVIETSNSYDYDD